MFGHKGGAQPWEAQSGEGSIPETDPQRAEPASSSAPYPRDATYAPRLDINGEGELEKLHPNYKLLMRITGLIVGVILVIGSIVLESALADKIGLWRFVLIAPAILIALFIAIRLPHARYNARGYNMSADRLRVVRGVLFHSDSVVPFGRVQHIDVDQGPIERALGIATMTLHTAGSHNASVHLPGLGHELAVQMREEIRAHIKRETL